MSSAAEPVHAPQRTVMLAVADASLAERIARAIPMSGEHRQTAIASSLLHLRLLASRSAPEAILIDGYLVACDPLADALRPFTAMAPVILLAPAERQAEAAQLVADGEVEFVARTGDFVPIDAQRLQTVVDLAVRLRETIRRLSDSWERRPNSLTPA